MLGPVLFVVVTASEPFFAGSACGNIPNTVGPTGDMDVHVVGAVPPWPPCAAPPCAAPPCDVPPEGGVVIGIPPLPPLGGTTTEAPPPPIGAMPPAAGVVVLPPTPDAALPPTPALVEPPFAVTMALPPPPA